MTTVVRLPPDQDRAAAAVLARAFQDDPMMVHLLPDPAVRRRRLPGFLAGCERYCQRYGVVQAVDGLGAVACWLPPGATTVSLPRMLRAGTVAATLSLGPRGARRLLSLISVVERAHHDAMAEPHWYLWLLGAEPDRARTGLGTRLLAPVLAQADAAGVPTYLDTHAEVNLRFYARSGFVPVVDQTVDGLRCWGLRRPPQP